MDFSTIDLTPAQQSFADEVRDTLSGLLTDELRANEREHGHSFDLDMHLALGRKGWLLPDRSPADGGAGLDKVQQRILELELLRQEAPSITAGTTRLVLQAVERFAVPELLAEILPKVASGEVRFCLGYTEPDGGSDIAGAKTRAVRDGDEWVINGQKIFTTGAQNCQYTFLITRTDPELPKHRGLTMFLVPLDSPGMTRISLDIACEFVRSRFTMGVPIGSLQGVSFPLTDVAINLDGTGSLVRKAAWLADDAYGANSAKGANGADSGQAGKARGAHELALAAFTAAARTATHGTTTSAHMQGGLGFTVEADASLYFLRSKGWIEFAGSPDADLTELGRLRIAHA